MKKKTTCAYVQILMAYIMGEVSDEHKSDEWRHLLIPVELAWKLYCCTAAQWQHKTFSSYGSCFW